MKNSVLPGRFSRSLNLANAASIVLYEAMRQNRTLWQDQPPKPLP